MTPPGASGWDAEQSALVWPGILNLRVFAMSRKIVCQAVGPRVLVRKTVEKNLEGQVEIEAQELFPERWEASMLLEVHAESGKPEGDPPLRQERAGVFPCGGSIPWCFLSQRVRA
jgi:hypothetical protein